MSTRRTIPDLLPNTQYAIRIRAVSEAGVSEWSRRFTFATISDTFPPLTPANVTWVSTGDSFHGEWDSVSTNSNGDTIPITRYELELVANGITKVDSVVPQTTSGKVTYDLSFEMNRALFNTPQPTVTLRVRAVDNKELKSNWTTVVSATNAIPTAPASLTATAGPSQVDLVWPASPDTDVIGYNLYVGASAGFTPSAGNRIYTGNALRFLWQTTTYSAQYFKVRAVDKFNQESVDATSGAATPVSPFVVDTTAPAVPTALAASAANNPNGIGGYALVSWTPPADSDLAGFVLRYRKNGTTDNYLTEQYDKLTTSVQVPLPLASTAYDFQVRAFDWQNNYSGYTGVVTSGVPSNAAPAVPTGLLLSAGRDNIEAKWAENTESDMVNGIGTYDVQIATDSGFTAGLRTYRTGATSINFAGLAQNQIYYVRVRATDSGGASSAYSASANATTGTFPTANAIVLTSTTQVLTSPSGGGTTTPATATVTGTASGTTITTYDYSVDGANFSGTVPAGVSRTGNVVTITGSTMTARTIAVRMSDGTISDTLTVAKNFDGATGGTGGAGPAGADGYTVLLTNEAQTIAAGLTSANAGTFTTNVNAYKGTVAQSVTVGTITGGATGISAVVTNNNTTNPLITFTVTTALTQANGTFTIPVTVGGITFTQIWTWSLAFTGSTGSTGGTGPAGVGVSGTATTYQVSSSGTVTPTGTWTSSVPSVPAGQFLWTRTITTYTDTSTSTAYSVGAAGTNGSNGSPGRGIASTTVTYQKSSNGTTAPVGTWTSAIPSYGPGEFLWTRTVLTYTDATTDTAYSVSAYGATGNAGKGVSSAATTYQKNTDGVNAPTGTWTSSIPSTVAGEFLWTRTITTYTDATTSTAYSVAGHGSDGADGGDGVGISTTTVTYQAHTSGTTAPTGTWTSSVPSVPAGQYLWTRTILTYTDATTSPPAYAVARFGTDGANGGQGPAGVGVSGTAVTYQASASGTTAPTGTWVASPPAVPAGQFLWTRTITTYTDTSTSTAYSVAGTGTNGSNGSPGRGISSTTVTYQVGSSGTTAPTGTWLSSVPSVPAGQYLWTRTVYNYTDATTDTAYAVAYAGTNGSNGTSPTAVDVGNDSVAIPVSAAGAALSAGTITIPFSGWIGTTRAAATVAVSGLPTGITVQTNTAATGSADGSLVLVYSNGATIGAADYGNITLTFTSNGQNFVRLFSWARAYTGAQGGTGGAGTSATSLDNTPDNIIIPTDASGNALSSSNVVMTLKGLVGTTASNVTIGAAPSLPAGVTATPAGSGGTSAQITFSWTSGANIGGAASSGSFVWPITVNGITFNKTIGWARAASGAQGPAGGSSDGVVPGAGNTPDVLSGLSYLYVKWAPVTTNASAGPQTDPVTYEVHLSTSTGFTPAAGTKVTEIAGTSMLVDHLPGTNTPLAYNTTYYVKIVPKDRDGSGAASAQGSGVISKVASTDVTSIGADLIVPGTGFINTIVVNTGGAIQSSNYVANTTGFKIDNSSIDIGANGYINAGALKAGTVTAVTINIGAGGSLNVDSTGQIKSNNWASLSTGYRLSNTGLEVNDGDIDAKSLRTNTAIIGDLTIGRTSDALGSIKSFGYSANTTGWRIDKTGMEINNGTIKAAALLLQQGENLMPAQYADFEWLGAYYATDFQEYALNGVASANPRFNSQYRFQYWVASTPGSVSRLWAGKSNTDYNIPLEASTNYIFSGYFRKNSGTIQGLKVGIKQDTGVVKQVTLSGTTVTATGTTWQRITGTFTTDASVTKGILYVEADASVAGDFHYDGLQIETKWGASSTPSNWTPGGFTQVDGGAIRTGSIQSTAVAQVWDNDLGTYKTDPAAQPAWFIDTAGVAKLGQVQVTGNIVVGTTTTPATAAPALSSGNYLPGNTGWIIRGDGTSEFRGMDLNSLHADTIISGTLTADMIGAGNISSDVNVSGTLRTGDFNGDPLTVTNKALTSNIATITTMQVHNLAVGQTVLITGVDATFNGTYVVSGTPDDKNFTFDKVNANVASTSSSGSARKIATGRSVIIDSSGINLLEADGVTSSVILPTDSKLPAYFSGQVNTSSISIADNMVLQGQNNTLTSGSVMTLAASILSPQAAPSVVYTYDNVQTWIGNNSYTAGNFGLVYDAGAYWTSNVFFGSGAMAYDSSGFFLQNTGMAGTEGKQNVWGGITKLGVNWYALVWDSTVSNWKVVKFANSGTGWDTVSSSWTYDLHTNYSVTSNQWKPDTSNGLKLPAIGNDGTNILIARCGINGTIRIASFTAAGSFNSLTNTNVSDQQDIASVMYGSFDLGGLRYIVTTRGSKGATARNYVFDASGVQKSNETWLTPSNYPVVGTTWNSSNSTFYSLTQSGKHYTYTPLAKNMSLGWSVKTSWYDADTSSVSVSQKSVSANIATLVVGAGHNFFSGDEVVVAGVDATFNGTYTLSSVTATTISYAKVTADVALVGATGTVATTVHESSLGSAYGFTVLRRAKLNLSIPSIPDNGRRNDPDSFRVYMSTTGTGGTHYLQPDPGVATKTFVMSSADIVTNLTSTAPAFPSGNAAKFVSSNGKLELSAAGTAIFGSVTDVNPLAGNTPALRLGDIMGTHLRMDGDEILAMTGDTTVGQLNLQLSGGIIKLGTLQTAVTAPGYVKTGVRTINVNAINTLNTASVSFSTPYPSSSAVPTVMLTLKDITSGTAMVRLSAANVTRSGFDIQIVRTVGAGNTDVAWLAIGE